MFFRPPESYPVVPLPPDTVKSLRARGLSRTRIARALRISPMKFFERVKNDPDLQIALDEGARLHQSPAPPPPEVAPPDAHENKFTPPVPLIALDDIILNAIAAGTCDRPAIERLLDPLRSRRVQITPSLERLIQHGKINPVPPQRGVILTKYAISETDHAPAAQTPGADDQPRRILDKPCPEAEARPR